MVFPALLLALALAGPEPAPSEAPKNAGQIVAGRAYDYSIEVSERLDELADATQKVLMHRQATLDGAWRQVGALAGLQARVLRARERQAHLESQLAELAPRHPVCTYAIDGSGGELLSPAGRAALDALARLGPGQAVSALLATCREALPDAPDARVACDWVALGASHPLCKDHPVMQPLCPGLDTADATAVPREVLPDLGTLMLARQIKRFGDQVDCTRATTSWLQQACAALGQRDAQACPTWPIRTQADLRSLLVDAPRVLAPVDFALESFVDPDSGELVVLHDGRFELRCQVEGSEGTAAELRLPLSDQPLSVLRLPLPATRGGGAPAVTCHATALVPPPDEGQAQP